MSIVFSCSLFFLSFMPLWVSVIFIDVKSIFEDNTSLWTEIISIITISFFILISLIVVFASLRSKGKEGTNKWNIISVKEEKAITSEYLLAYILPLFAFDFTKWDNLVIFLLFFLTLGFLCVRHNYFSVNIVLELFKYRFYKCDLENEDEVNVSYTVISRRSLTGEKGEEVLLRSLNNEVKLDTNKK